jgi:hypothetical protein
MSVYASSKSVHVKCHPGAFSALHSTELSHTHSQYTGSIRQLCSTTRGNRETFSDFMVNKLQQTFVVLQPGDLFSCNLLEAFVQIRDDVSCNDSYSGALTDRMICAGSHSGFMGPCHVSFKYQ